MKQQHTPTPWRISEVFGRGHKNHIAGADDYQVSDCESYKKSLIEQEANAAFIVKCVNAHDELVEALRDVTMQFEHYRRETADGRRPSNEVTNMSSAYILKANKAIAKVKP